VHAVQGGQEIDFGAVCCGSGSTGLYGHRWHLVFRCAAMKTLRRIGVTILAGVVSFGFSSLIVLPQLPLHDLGACFGFVFWLGLPVVVMCFTPQRWDEFVEAREERRRAEERKIEAARYAEAAHARRIRESEESQRLEAERRARKKAEDNKRKQDEVTAIVISSEKTLAFLPRIAERATEALNKSEHEFDERAFAPFWDAIEIAVNALASFNSDVRQIIANREQYHSIRQQIEGPATPFNVDLALIPDATYVAERMTQIVRKAQKDFQFSVIYEQRKTNRLLAGGFSSLGHAISNLSSTVHSSISDLRSALTDQLSDLGADIRDQGRLSREEADANAERAARLAAQTADAIELSNDEQTELLENIRDRLKPSG
jgi:hypothetical protein